MVIVLKNIANEKIVYQEVRGTFSLQEAKLKFENEMFIVQDIQEEVFGDYTNVNAAQIIENEGICYAVQSYIDWKEFKDPETRRLWKLADDVLCQLAEHLGVEQ